MRIRITDQDQVSMLKNWWNEYGKAIAFAIIVGLLIGYGWQWWTAYRAKQLTAASTLYQQMLNADQAQQPVLAIQTAKQLTSTFKHTPYASMAALYLAAQSVNQKQNADALAQLNWVIQHGDVKSLQEIARLRAARIQIAQQQPQAALTLLNTVDDQSFQPMIDAELGDVYKAMGQNDQARKSYEKASKELALAHVSDPFLSFKASLP